MDEPTRHDLAYELRKFASWVERDRREPDKLLCHVASMRRVALEVDWLPSRETNAPKET